MTTTPTPTHASAVRGVTLRTIRRLREGDVVETWDMPAGKWKRVAVREVDNVRYGGSVRLRPSEHGTTWRLCDEDGR